MERARNAEVMKHMMGLLKENMASLEDMEEQRLRMMEEHEEEKRRLRAQLEAEWEAESAKFREECERKMQDVSQDMAEFERDSQTKMAAEKKDMEGAMMEKRADFEREKMEMERRMEEFRRECEGKMAEEKARTEKMTLEAQAECDRMGESRAKMVREMSEFRVGMNRKMQEEKAEMSRVTTESLDKLTRVEQEKVLIQRQTEEFRMELEKRMEEEKRQVMRQMERFRHECETKMEHEKKEHDERMETARKEASRIAEEKAEMVSDMQEFRGACERILEEQKEEMSKQSDASKLERERISGETARAKVELDEYLSDCERKMAEEKREMERDIAELQTQNDRRMAQEKATNERQMKEARQQLEDQLRAEREITNHVWQALKELPPLQGAMELGDLRQLGTELAKWNLETLPERFGECRGVVEAVVKLARERLVQWRGVEHTLKDVLKEAESLPGNVVALQELCQKLFRAIKEAQLTKLDLRRGDGESLKKLAEVFLTWQERAMLNSNAVQQAMVRKVVTWPDLGPFDFADLDICLRLVDREARGNEIFLSRAQAVVDDEACAPKDLKSTLAHVETMLFFLKYTKSEDLRLTYHEFRTQTVAVDVAVRGYLEAAERSYPPGAELVHLPPGGDESVLTDTRQAAAVLEQLRRPASRGHDGLGVFREIFYQWAVAMRSKFDLLVLPHHTQVVALLAFRSFLEALSPTAAAPSRAPPASPAAAALPRALIAQVSTGEGKSMIVAALAIYVVVSLGKKAHVVVDDESLLERDFWTFKGLFDMFEVPAKGDQPKRKLKAVLCVAEQRAEKGAGSCVSARVDPEADICYCEAKHVQSFYASIARSEQRDFAAYRERVLILDEVDALVIDEEPNEPFVYPNQELCEMATSVADQLAREVPREGIQAITRSGEPHPAAPRLLREMYQEWDKALNLVPGEDCVFVKEIARYCKLHSGRANTKAWSLALECRNFQEGLSREILFQERLFVMSRPRVFRKYHCILGLSGSIGSESERRFLKETYSASFFEVPPFLRTCRGSPFHDAVAAPLGQRKQATYVEATGEAQLARLAEVALEAREQVPVLVIAKDRGHADLILEHLRSAARSRGLGGAVADVIRPLSRAVYEADPEMWKENLNRATLPVGDRTSRGGKSWRITVTDPRGARGTDYRVDDPDVDSLGGLLLLPTVVPASQRDWKQYLGRTARQDRRGQYCAVLCATDYAAQLPPCKGGADTSVIQAILALGDAQISQRIRSVAALYNSGVRANELCEDIFAHRPELLKDAAARELLVDACQKIRYMSVKEIDAAFARLPGFQPGRIVTEAHDMGRPEEPPVAVAAPGAGGARAGGAGARSGQSKVVLFCLDRSCSMMSNDTGTPLTRFAMCVKSVLKILQDHINDEDLVCVVCFASTVEMVVPPSKKGPNMEKLKAKIASIKPDWQGGTCFFDAMMQGLQLLSKPGVAPPGASKWIVCLTDGDDLGSRRENNAGQLVDGILSSGGAPGVNMVTITVGKLKDKNLQVIDAWSAHVANAGCVGKHITQKNASAIAEAFEVVAEILEAAGESGGAIEC